MKCIRRPSRAEKERILSNSYDLVTKSIADNYCVMLCALHRMGWGEKRINDFRQMVIDVQTEYKKHDEEDLYEYRLIEELKTFGQDYYEITSGAENYQQCCQRIRLQDKNRQVSVADAYKAKRELDLMKKLL